MVWLKSMKKKKTKIFFVAKKYQKQKISLLETGYLFLRT